MLITAYLCVIFIKISSVFSDSFVIDSNRSSEDYVPCEIGWYYFRDKCYKAEKGRGFMTWTAALDRCRDYGADLVSIQSQEEQDFIIAFLLLEHDYVSWIGLSDRENESDYRWSDGSSFNYTNWDEPNEPSELDEKDDCVHMFLYPVGKWNDVPCDKYSDYICKKKPNPENRSPNLMYCSWVEGRGWRYRNSCYHIVPELKSWQDAETYCKNKYKGHILSIEDMKEDSFFEFAPLDIKKEMWIGIKIQAQLQQKWASDWYVSFMKFNKKDKFVEGNCVARKNQTEWITIPCSRQLPFICEVSKGTPPLLKPPPIGSYCPKDLYDWRDFDGEYCYSIHTKNEVNFTEARSRCQGRGGDLVSIHSEQESDILLPFIKDDDGSIYIGLVRSKGSTGPLFRWTDGSVYDYNSWDDDEPRTLEDECTVASRFTMKWKNTPCDKKVSGYICSVKKISARKYFGVKRKDTNKKSSKFTLKQMIKSVRKYAGKTLKNDVTAGCSSSMLLKTLISLSVCIHIVKSLLGSVM